MHHWKALIRRRAHRGEDAEEVVLRVPPREDGLSGDHLRKNAPSAPNVGAVAVHDGAEDDVWGAVPQRHHVVAVLFDRNPFDAREAKVGDLQHALLQQQILRFEVSVDDAVAVEVREAGHELPHEAARVDGEAALDVRRQVAVAVLKDHRQLRRAEQNIVEADNVRVRHLPQDHNFADRSAQNALRLVV